MAGNRTSPRRTSGAPTQQPPGRGRRGATASNGAIAAAAAANAGGDGEILEVDLNPTHAADIRDTTNHEMDNETEKDHRRRNTEFIKWMKTKYPAQFDHCVVELTEEQRADPDRKYYGATHDFLYDKINPAILKAFLSGEKKYIAENGRSAKCKMCAGSGPLRATRISAAYWPGMIQTLPTSTYCQPTSARDLIMNILRRP